MRKKTKLRVLTVDDDRVFRLSIRYTLEALGYEVAGEACSGEEAIKLAHQLRPDLVLMDIDMPGKSGLEAARDIQALMPVPIIIISGYEDPATFNEAAESGVAAYLVKPVLQAEVERTITIALARFEDMMEMRHINLELDKALKAVETLQGLLPICVACQKVRDDNDYWRQVKDYIGTQANTTLTHGVCSDCAKTTRAVLDKV